MATENHHRVHKTSEMSGVKLSEIEQGLSALWQQAGERRPGEPSAAAMRICTLNLIAYVSDDSSTDAILDAAMTASHTQPMRVVLLVPEADKEGATEGRLAGYCRLTDQGNLQICCEQIVLTARGKAIDELPSSVGSSLVSDLPVILWWTGKPPFGTDFLHRFEDISDYLIIDSREFDCTAQNFQEVCQTILRHPQVGIGDLNWSRLLPWREATAGIFDAPSAVAEYLGSISSLDIEYVGPPRRRHGNNSQAMIYAGWLGSRLGWTMDGEVSIGVRPVSARGIEPGDIVAASIEIADSKARFKLTRRDDPHCIGVSAEGAASVSRTVPFDAPSLGDLVADAVSAMGADLVYAEALSFATDLLDIGCGQKR